MDHNNIIECGGFYFVHCFDSGNLGHVERVPTELIVPSVNHKTNSTETPDYEFNLWTRPDCAGTEFENGNRTWFYFGVQATEPNSLVRLNLMNLNRQGKMYNQGMAPVTRTLPGKPQWERIKDRPVHSMDDNTFTLTFKYRTSDNLKATTFFAFTYPFSFAELQIALNSIDLKMLPLPLPQSLDDIYYHRECLIYSLEGRRVDLLTISSNHGITQEREVRLKNLFPDNKDRPFKFVNKKIIFISARVHPGETPSSFVFNGFLNLLLTRYDPIAMQLRKLYVFKMIPFLNPDGVARGHYRTDTRGVNLNRVYLNPSLTYHPTVYASRALIRYYHFGCEKEDIYEDSKSFISHSIHNISETSEIMDVKKKKLPSITSHKDKSNELNRDKERSNKQLSGSLSNKSTCTLKQPSTSDHSNKGVKTLSDASTLVDQVNEMKLQELCCESAVPLNDTVLRECLGCDVHVTASEELRLLASNPLRPLRDTLKNSISLLMDSPVAGDASVDAKDSVRLGWCRACRGALARLEDSMPGYSALVPGYTLTMSRSASPTYSSIDEYREHQKVQFDTYERKMQEFEEAKSDTVYFCTNCFKRYIISEDNEEIVQVCGVVSNTSEVGLGALDASEGSDASGASGGSGAPPLSPDSGTGDATPTSPPPSKSEKPRSPVGRQGKKKPTSTTVTKPKEPESGLFLYIDLHGHASKKGIFMYGNHFEELESSVECMLLPRIMSLNNLHFHFSSCNFTERNMYLKDRRDGMSREGSGRVAVYKATGLVRSYTLECNYNTGRLVNVLPPARDAPPAAHAHAPPPPKYTPHIFEEVRHCRAKSTDFFEEIDPGKVGVSLGASILDLTGQHPNSRVPASEHRSLPALRDWLRTHTRTMRPQLTMSRLRPKTSSPSRVPLYSRGKTKTEERKENTYLGAKTDSDRPSLPPPRDYTKKEPAKTNSRTRYLADEKPKMMTSKRRSILAIRKPNASKTQVVKKISRRSADDAGSRQSLTSKLSKSFSRGGRAERRGGSSSSEEVGAWEGASAPKRRPFPAPTAPLSLKKIRLKTGL